MLAVSSKDPSDQPLPTMTRLTRLIRLWHSPEKFGSVFQVLVDIVKVLKVVITAHCALCGTSFNSAGCQNTSCKSREPTFTAKSRY